MRVGLRTASKVLIAALAALPLLHIQPAAAAERAAAIPGAWTLRAGLGFVDREGPTGRADARGSVVDVFSSSATTTHGGVGYRLGRRWSLGLTLGAQRTDYQFRIVDVEAGVVRSAFADLRSYSLTAETAFHPFTWRFFDLRLAPVVGYEHYDSVIVDRPAGADPVRLALEDSWSYGGLLGLAFGPEDTRWSVDLSLLSLRAEVAARGPGSGDEVDRLRIRLALAIRLGAGLGENGEGRAPR